EAAPGRRAAAHRTARPPAHRTAGVKPSRRGSGYGRGLSSFRCVTGGARGHRAPSRREEPAPTRRRPAVPRGGQGERDGWKRSTGEDEMSITFRIATAADDEARPMAVISARQLAAFRTFLRGEGERIGTVLLDPDAPEDAFLSYRFEARVCPIALASIARLFDFATDVI